MVDLLLEAQALEVERDGRRVLGPLDLEAETGRCLGVLGPNGAGKSTLLEALLGLIPHRGRIRRRAPMAWVPQRSELRSDLSVRSVVMQGRFRTRGDARPTEGDAAIVDVALGDAGAAALGDRRYLRLSEGEKRRVLIARALAAEAPLLLLDEPTAGLDLGHALDLCALLRRLAGEGRGLVVVMHDLALAARFMDHLLVLREGRPAAEGPAAAALDADVLARVWGIRAVEAGAPRFERSEPR